MTVIEEEIMGAHEFFKTEFGFEPKIFRPPFGNLDTRTHKYLEELGYTIIMWSAGCVDWYFADKPELEMDVGIKAMRYTQAEAGSIMCMHDTAQGPNNAEYLRTFLDDTWNFW